VPPTGETIVRASTSKTSVEVLIKTRARPAPAPSDPKSNVIELPRLSEIERIDIRVNGKPIDVHAGAYLLLTDVHHAEVTVGPKLMVLTLEGGETATSYTVRYEFDSTRLKRRIVASALFGPGKGVLEDSRYYVPVLGP
jgi:hypothetical protein